MDKRICASGLNYRISVAQASFEPNIILDLITNTQIEMKIIFIWILGNQNCASKKSKMINLSWTKDNDKP